MEALIMQKHINILFGTTAIMLLMANVYQPRFLFFEAGSFVTAFIFFISGYIVDPNSKYTDRLLYSIKNTGSYLGLYFLFAVIFALITVILKKLNIPIYSFLNFETASDTVYSIKMFLAYPFIGAEPNTLFQAGWILVYLWLINLAYSIISFSVKNVYSICIMFTAFLISAVLISNISADSENFNLFWLRFFFCLSFFMLGFTIKTLPERLHHMLIAPVSIVISYICAQILIGFWGLPIYKIEYGLFPDAPSIIILLVTTIIVLMLFQITYYLSKILSDTSYLISMGKSFIWILISFEFVKYCINIIFYAVGQVSFDDMLEPNFVYNINKLWLLYFVPAIMIPVYLKRIASKLSK
jgi:hypothetical protein